MALIVLGLNHRTSPVEVRERFAYGEHAVPLALAGIREAGIAREAVLLSTCNRVEVYVSCDGDPGEVSRQLRQFLLRDRGLAADTPADFYVHLEKACVEHLFRVAAGLDSLVLGETEILGQLKKAYDQSLKGGFTGGRLNKVFQKAFSVAKQIRTDTQIQRGNTSVASVAVELAEKIFEQLHDRHVMVIGAGDTSEKTARALLSRGARSVMVSNRSYERAAALAAELGGKAIHFDEWEASFQGIDIIISSTSAPHYVLDRPRLERLMDRRQHRALLLMDLAVPRDIDPDVEHLENVYLYNVDHLQTVADEHVRQRREEVARCESMIRDKVAPLFRDVPSPVGGPTSAPKVQASRPVTETTLPSATWAREQGLQG
jgi:glutamyl-tRNA reductase